MKISDYGLALVMAFEGCHKAVPGKPGYFRAYKDPIGVLTIGWGHTNHHPPKFTENDVWSQAKCDEVLRSDMERFEKAVLKLVKVPLKQHQFDALVSFTYNCGEGNLGKSTLLKRVNAQDWKGAEAGFAQWNKAGGKVLAGLTRRRKAEAEMFAGMVDQALKTAGAKKPPTAPQPKPDNVATSPSTPEPVDPKQGWISALFTAIASILKRA